MPSYSSWDTGSKPFVEGYFVLPKAIGRAAIRDGLAINEGRDHSDRRSHHNDPGKRSTALVSMER